MNIKIIKIIVPLAVFLLLITMYFVFHRQAKAEAAEKVSEFGKYRGYSEKVYDGWKRTSDYLSLSDGTRLAYDLFIPTKEGVPATEPLPTLFKYTPYGRAWTIFGPDGHCHFCDLDRRMPWWSSMAMRFRSLIVPIFVPGGNGNLKDVLGRTEWTVDLVLSGYTVIMVERPGTAASFGQFHSNPDVIAQEADEILNWIAEQDWSDGNIGMFGDSIQAQIQFQAASTGNPHLKAIFPATTWMDSYSGIRFPGGIHNQVFDEWYTNAQKVFDNLATPVDRDTDGALLKQARLDRQSAVALAELANSPDSVAYRDELTLSGEKAWITQYSLYPLLDRINRAGVPTYLINGWYDIFARDNFLIYANLTGPKRLLVRPTDHAGIEAAGADIDYGAEAHRWFDYWLKGIDNGIMDEAPIHYYLQGAGRAQAYQSAETWPLANQTVSRYYLASDESDSRVSTNAGRLGLGSPAAGSAFDAYTVDYTTTTGKWPLWAALALPHKYPNMQSNDSKALTYTTPPLETAITIVGHPIVHIWLSSEAPDLDVFVYLEEVDANGNSTYITEGELRASHRQLGQAPFDNLGLPWRNHFQSERQPIPKGEPIELVFDLRPTAWHFSPGKQIRITIAFADAGNFDTPILDPAPTLQLLRDAAHPSCVELPIAQYP